MQQQWQGQRQPETPRAWLVVAVLESWPWPIVSPASASASATLIVSVVQLQPFVASHTQHNMAEA